jgi:hypothetical protein
MHILMVRDGHWYASKEALAKAKKLHLVGDPHVTPDGKATMVFDAPNRFAMQADHGHDLMHFDGTSVVRVEFAAAELDDVEMLVEFDHLPESRKETSWMLPGSKLA